MKSKDTLFIEAFDEYSDMLYRHCIFRLSNKERAPELVQDTFTKTWDYVQKGGTIKKYKPFLFRVLNNLIIDEYRKKKDSSLEELLAKDGVHEHQFEELYIDSDEDTLSKVDTSEDTLRLRHALSQLSDKERELITFRYIDELSLKDIATIQDKRLNTLVVQIHRALAHLRQIMENEDKYTNTT